MLIGVSFFFVLGKRKGMERRIAGSRWNDLVKTREGVSLLFFLDVSTCILCVLIGSGCRRSICAIF